VTRKTTKRRGLRRFLPRGGWLLLAVLAMLVYWESIPPWMWTLVAGVVVVAVVYYWLGFRRGRRR
jgi:O-antigen/teichoic acid export membrane protein